MGGRLTVSGTLCARGGHSASDNKSGGGRIAIWPGTSPEEAAQRIANADLRGLSYRATVSSFTGTLDAAVPPNENDPPAGDGTAGFYMRANTVVVIR